MEGISNILEAGSKHLENEFGKNMFGLKFEQDGGIEVLEELQLHVNTEVYEKAKELLEKYYEEND